MKPIVRFVALSMMLWVAPISAGNLDDAKIALHVRPHAKAVCATAPTETPCSEFVTSGRTLQPYDVYLIVAQGPETEGIAGLSCGLDYNGALSRGVDILQWTRCASLEFTGGWPASGAGNRIVWANQTQCQTRTVGGEGVQAIAGALYVYAYDPDVLAVIPNYSIYPPELSVADCRAEEAALDNEFRGSVRFSPDGTERGSNPCVGEPPPAAPAPPPPPPLAPLPPPPSYRPTPGGTQARAKVLFHLQSHGSSECAAGPAGMPCAAFDNEGETGIDYDVYLVVAQAAYEPGVAGVFCGLRFDARSSQGVDVLGWTSCADLEDAVYGWPQGGGNRLTWSPETNCQRGIPGAEVEGVHVIAGAFYVHAYGADVFSVTAHPENGRLMVNDCASVGTELPYYSGGTVRFRSAAARVGRGWNPCLDSPPSVPEFIPTPPEQHPARLLLHIGEAPAGPGCHAGPSRVSDVVTSAALKEGGADYHVYMLGTPSTQGVGLTGLQLGIDYEGGEAGQGLVVSSWRGCAMLDFPMPSWPASGSGNTITWSLDECQEDSVVTAGFFTVTAYSPTVMSIAPYPTTGLVKIADCHGAEGQPEVVVGVAERGWISFGGAGRGVDVDGCNPALAPCATPVSVEPTTWGRIKAKYRG